MLKRKIKYIVSVLILILMLSCGIFDSRSSCERIIPQNTMVQILAEVYLIEAYLSSHIATASLRDSVPHYYADVFGKHGTNAKEFEDALRCYLLDRDQMNWLLDDLLSFLSIEQSRTTPTHEQQD